MTIDTNSTKRKTTKTKKKKKEENNWKNNRNLTYLGINPLANSKNGILCDFVPPIVTIKISAAKHVLMLASTTNNFELIVLYSMEKLEKQMNQMRFDDI